MRGGDCLNTADMWTVCGVFYTPRLDQWALSDGSRHAAGVRSTVLMLTMAGRWVRPVGDIRGLWQMPPMITDHPWHTGNYDSQGDSYGLLSDCSAAEVFITEEIRLSPDRWNRAYYYKYRYLSTWDWKFFKVTINNLFNFVTWDI